jgi:hypothetical protein
VLGRRQILTLPAALLAACSRVPRGVEESDDLAALRAQIELPFEPAAARWAIRRHASGGRVTILYAYLVAIFEVAPAGREEILAKLRKQPKGASAAIEIELGAMKGDLAQRARRPGASWHVALPLFRGKKYRTSDVSEMKVYDDGVVAILLASPNDDA